MTGLLIVLTGFSGSGKDVVLSKILQEHPNLYRVVTTTTRSIREGEIDGQDYHFITFEQFQRMKQAGEFIEDVTYSGDYYGTTKKDVARVLSGQDIIWRIDPSRAAEVERLIKDSYPPEVSQKILENTLVIFISVPDQQTLHNRLIQRGMSEEKIQERFKTDSEEWERSKGKFKNVVANFDGALNKTASQVLGLIEAKRQSLTTVNMLH